MREDSETAPQDLFAGGGETGALMRAIDWSSTSLGAVADWSQSLKTAVRIMLTSRQAMFVWWGKELINLYNDAYKAIVGGKHPAALGQPASLVWREIWEQVGPRAASAMLKNEGTYDEALLLIMERNGYPEETYYTFSYSPVPDDQGNTGGIICANTDDTQRIIGERQLVLLRELATRTANARTFDEACTLSASCLAANPYDLPFALIYLVAPDERSVFLAGTSGIDRSHPAVPETVDLETNAIWSLAEVAKTHQPRLMTDLTQFGELPTGAWQRPPQQAVVVPIAPSGQTGRAGILVVGLNPYRLFNNDYQRFIDLAAAQISASIANANAYEEERKRAEALAEIDRAKTAFFSNVSHEFRTPLTLMLGPLEDLLTHGSNLPDADREQLEAVHRNSLRLLKLVNTLLDFSRIEAGRIQAVYEPTDLATFTSELSSVFRSAIERANMRLVVDCPTLPQPIYVDREMWEKIVLNLLSNAFKFTFAGEIRVSLRLAAEQQEDQTPKRQGIREPDLSAPGNAVVLEVCDTGIGIPAAEIPHLFERFHRVPGAQGRTYEGSGIGLSLVQELVKLHSGKIDVMSAVNQGTCFRVSVPMGTAHLPPERIRASRSLISTATRASSYIEEALRWLPPAASPELITSEAASSLVGVPSSARILLVDDNADMRDYVKRLLSPQYQVEAATDGLAALAAARRQTPDLVLTDVMMPNLDGFGLLNQLRSDPRTKDIPVILLSARAGEESRLEGLSAGADDYLIKPFSARELLARVEANLKLSRLRKQSEAELREVYVQLESALVAGAVYTWRWRIRENRVTGNAALAHLFAVDPIAVANGLPIEKFVRAIHPEDRRRVMAAMQQTIESGEEFVAEYRVHSATGEERWVAARGIVERDLMGNPVSFPGALADITEHKQAEAQIRQQATRLQRLAAASLAVNSTLSLDRIVHLITQQAQEIIGAHQSVTSLTIGQDWAQAVHTVLLSDKYADWQNYAQHSSNPGVYRPVCQVQQPVRMTQAELEAHPDWQGLDRESAAHPPLRGWLAAPLTNHNGEITGLIQLSDKYEGEFTEQDEAILVQLAQMASAAIVNAQLYEESQRANRLKDEFLAVLSHELRSPLNPILGWASLLKSGRLDAAKTASAIEAIERNAKLQVQLIEDLLDVSRILRGKLSLNMLPVNLETTIQAALETVQLAAEVKQIEIHFVVANALPGAGEYPDSAESWRTARATRSLAPPTAAIQVLGDAARLQQVLWNLLSNAVKFTPAGGQVDVQLSVTPQPPVSSYMSLAEAEPPTSPGQVTQGQVTRYAQITVTDTGKGIAPEFLPYVFDYFRQADSSTTRQFGGLGLGLAIVRHLVELHGGMVQASSLGENQGATFTIRLPLLQTDAEDVLEGEAARTAVPNALPLQQVAVLLVDDDPDTRDVMELVLKQAGAIVTSVASAVEALRAFEQTQFDVLVSDIGMPDIDGYRMIRYIRAMSPQQGRQIPAIALTAYAGELNQQQALAAGFQRHLAKPIDPPMLIETIVSLVQSI